MGYSEKRKYIGKISKDNVKRGIGRDREEISKNKVKIEIGRDKEE